MLKQLIVLCAIASTVLCRNTASNYNSLHNDQLSDKEIGNNDKNDESFLNWMDISSIYHKYKNYTSSDISVFLKLKLLTSLNSVAKGDIDFGNGVRFVRDRNQADSNQFDEEAEFSENTIMKTLPRTIGDSEDFLNTKIWKRIGKLMRSHTIQMKFPTEFEGRGDGKKKGAWIMIPLLLAGTFIPLAYGALALLAGKALIVSKLALVLASIIGIKKLVSQSGGHHESSHEVVVAGHGGGSGWARAYSAHAPKN